ncbi:hypothetical protein [Actinomyces sp. Z5]|uniref:hypothetical protein n=1 Tax=Actinomyces sp. Z5 TaxID=2250216 RepID=UPI0011BDCF9F|nr:hypothetical protein [Actinomyces sp. Z5]
MRTSPADDTRLRPPRPARAIREAALTTAVAIGLVSPMLAGCTDSVPTSTPSTASPTPTTAAVSTTAPAGMAADIPDTLGQQVRWQRVIDDDDAEIYHVEGVLAGASGPIVVTGHGAMGLDPETGETTWSYRDPEGTMPVTGYGVVSAERAHGQAVLSPDGTHLVLGLSSSTSNFATRLVGLDTGTGEVLFDHEVTGYAIVSERAVDLHIQVTDHVVMAEREVISLEDGSVLATLPPDPAVVDGDRQCLRTDVGSCESFWPGSQGGHSTLILDSTCWSPGQTATSWCELTLAPDDDPTASRQVGGFVPIDRTTGDAEGQSTVDGDNLDSVCPVLTPPVVDGWVIRYSDVDAAYAAMRDDDADPLSLPLEAMSLDALVSTNDAAPVPLGTSGQTVRDYGARTLAVAGADGKPGDAVVFDPATRQVQGVDQALEQGTGAVYLDALTVTRSGRDLDITRPDGSVALHLTEYDARIEHTDAYLVPAPGVIVAVERHRTTSEDGKTDESEVVIFGVG